MTLTILADDLTGACDTGTLFAGKEAVPVTVWPRRPHEAPVRVVDTESRTVSAREAARRVRAAMAAAPATHYFKKIDSTLRGRVGAEVDAMIRATRADTVVLCPAFPAQGRAVVDRILLVNEVPIAETPLARDPEFPRSARVRPSSNVIDLLRPQLDRAFAWVSLSAVRAGVAALAARLGRLSGTVVMVDAETDTDLDSLAEAALDMPRMPLLVGSAGLARALAARLGLLPERAVIPPARRWLIVAGSLHPATRAQIEAARGAGMDVLATAGDEPGPRSAAAARLAEEARRRIEGGSFDLIAVTGGETALALWEALNVERVDLVGTPAAGLALGYLHRPGQPPLLVLTKAGGFGAPDLFVSLRREAAA